MSGGTVFCPRCGVARTGPVCTNCSYDFLEGAKTPAVTLQRGVNWVSVAVIVFALGVVGVIVWFFAQFT